MDEINAQPQKPKKQQNMERVFNFFKAQWHTESEDREDDKETGETMLGFGAELSDFFGNCDLLL